MIDYTHEALGYGNSKYSISYKELRENYFRICRMDNKEFLSKLSEVVHLACVIAWFKEIPVYVCLCDEGIIHQIIHLIHLGYGKDKWANDDVVKKIRKQFKNELKLNTQTMTPIQKAKEIRQMLIDFSNYPAMREAIEQFEKI